MSEQLIKWNRRTRWAIKWRHARTRLRGFVIGTGFAYEAETWGQSAVFIFHGALDNGDGEHASVAIWGCPICAALVIESNRAYHERWHIAGSVSQ